MIGQTWNPAAYAQNGRFVATMANAVVDLLNPQSGEHILDLGCGDGALTAQLAAFGAILRGVDASAAMVDAARQRAAFNTRPSTANTPHSAANVCRSAAERRNLHSPVSDPEATNPAFQSVCGFGVDHHSAQSLPYVAQFDAVFSNAALHWIPAPDQPAALARIHRALKPGGRFVAEMGGQGNIAAIRTALSAVLAPHSLDAEALAASFFPSPAAYRTLLEAAGFKVHTVDLHPRLTPLPGGPDGMHLWLNTFRNGVLDQLLPARREAALTAAIALLRPILHDPATDTWTADYVRLRFKATKSRD